MYKRFHTRSKFPMKFIFHSLPLLVLFCCIGTVAQAQSKQDSAKVLHVNKFEKWSNKQKPILVDVRTPEEMEEGYIEGAENIDFLDENFEEKIALLDKSKVYLLYCRSGKRTAKAGALMKASGFKKVKMLQGGMRAWEEAGKPIVK